MYKRQHSDDSLCLYEADLGLVFAGDTLMRSSLGRADLPGGDLRVLVEGIRRRLLTLPGETEVFPGHGDPTTVAAEKNNPFLL